MYDICFVLSYEKYIAETILIRTRIFVCVLNAPYMWNLKPAVDHTLNTLSVTNHTKYTMVI